MSEASGSEKVSFLLEGQEVLTYDRSIALTDQQKNYLEDMDKTLEEGFMLAGQKVEQPDLEQKTQFVALNLVQALQKEDDKTAIILFSYLVDRMPELKQAKARVKESESGNKIGIEFIFDEIKPEGQKLEFHPKPPVMH